MATEQIIPLGARLRQRREERGLSQSQAARELDVARTAYRLWELEAARPAPDRWRTIAKWLGLSVTALLVADELIDESEAGLADIVADHAGMTSEEWDAAAGRQAGDFFSQSRVMIDDHSRAGAIQPEQALRLHATLTRLQDTAAHDAFSTWHAARLVKRFPTTLLAPALARAAVGATILGVPPVTVDEAMLLTSELVTNSVQHSDSDWVEVDIEVNAQQVRIEVADADPRSISPRTPGPDGGWGVALLAGIATRWGAERRTDGKTIWIELDLPQVPRGQRER